MTRITPDELWRLLVETGLCSRSVADALRAEHDAAPATAGGTRAVAAWLVGKGVLTGWQAKRLASGDTGPFTCGAYRLLERREHDGRAYEFTARHEPSGRIVTLVLLSRSRWRDAAVRGAIERRLAIARRAADPLLVRTLAMEEAAGRPFVICEEVRGGTLADELEQRGPPTLREAGEIGLAVAKAVAELHAAGEVHGGLSLDALVREPAVTGGRLRLRQFPLATDPHQVPPRAAVADAEELRHLGRRAAFVAPELAAGAPCDARSDVYALGCILHALVAGRAPGWSGDPRQTLECNAAGPGPLDPAVAPPQLARLVDYLTARDPGDRYPDAAEAARAIATTFGFPPPELAAAPVTAAPAGGGPDAARVASAGAPHRAAHWLRNSGAALAAGILAAAVAIVMVRTKPTPRPIPPVAPPVVVADAPVAPVAEPTPREPEVVPATGPVGPMIVDDASVPWQSPTAGRPPVFATLPAGSQALLITRPAAMLADAEGQLLVRALGPDVAAALASVAAACGCRPEEIESLQAGWQAGAADEVIVGWTARLVEGRSLPTDEAVRERTWGPAAPAPRAGETIHAGPRLSYWAPSSAAGQVLVAAPAGPLAEIVEASAGTDLSPLALPGDVERLVGVLDAERHLTVVGSPHYLLNRGRGLFAGTLEPLAAEIEALLGESAQAAALSVHCGPDFYVELDAIAALDLPARAFATRLMERIGSYPAAAKAFCAARDLHPYGRALVMELPTMVRALAAHVRGGAEGRVAVVNAYLPRHAGHNIALAGELALAQAPNGGVAAAAATATTAAPAAPQGALDRLGQPMTLVFAKDTLDKSIQMIADEIGVPMEILGPDLQLEGITKNQSFGLDEQDKPAREILRVILAKANPDGKLVYVVRKQDGVESIVITTRAAAANRGDVLPPGFQDAAVERQKGAK